VDDDRIEIRHWWTEDRTTRVELPAPDSIAQIQYIVANPTEEK
jgi:hypothetical protein